ncbi:hypothetical protein K458DRAFT_393728 [Lentithecium fluviatile CBS 122367]|uniref:Uncharacterized protein n=1 Tax=Lentithecium fluviatile CBS 122367 TaxID=1168545 RepID=A0A6G1IMY1_9PLEO|nr:hypothetical protein K458DRAFT_393728 [Lentithecium fluviatile CBS 122367]
MNTQEQPVRFLDLSTETCYLVYEFLPCRTKQHKFIAASHNHRFSFQADEKTTAMLRITLITQGCPVQLLCVCELISKEAAPFLQPKFEQQHTLRYRAPRMITNREGFNNISVEFEHWEYFDRTSYQPKIRQWIKKTATDILQLMANSRYSFGYACPLLDCSTHLGNIRAHDCGDNEFRPVAELPGADCDYFRCDFPADPSFFDPFCLLNAANRPQDRPGDNWRLFFTTSAKHKVPGDEEEGWDEREWLV